MRILVRLVTMSSVATPQRVGSDEAREPRRSNAGTWRWMTHAATRTSTITAAILVALPVVGWAFYVWRSNGLNDGVTLGSAFMSGASFAYAVAAGLGSWIGYREQKLGLDQLTGPSVFPSNRSRLTILCGTSLALVLATVLGGVVVNLGMLAAPHRVGHVGLAPIVATAFMVALWMPLGYLVGRRFPHLLVVPLVAIAGWLIPSMTPGGQGTPLSMLLPATATGGSTFTVLNGSIMWGQLLWFAGLWCALVSVLVYRRGSLLPMVFAALGIMSCVLGFALMANLHFARFVPAVVNGELIDYDRCAGNAPVICLHPAFEGLRPELASTFGSLMQKLAGTPGYAEKIEHRPRGIGQDPAAGTKAFFLDHAKPSDSRIASAEYVEGLRDPDECYGTDTSASLPWSSIVYQWLTETLPDPDSDTQYAGALDPSERRKVREQFLALTESERHAWFVDHYDRFATCTLVASDFGR